MSELFVMPTPQDAETMSISILAMQDIIKDTYLGT